MARRPQGGQGEGLHRRLDAWLLVGAPLGAQVPPSVRAQLAALPAATVLPAFRRGNVVGALQVGMRPRSGGLDTRGLLQAAADGKVELLVLVGADPLGDFPDNDLARRTEQQASSLEQTSASVQEISTAVRKSAQGSEAAAQIKGRVAFGRGVQIVE